MPICDCHIHVVADPAQHPQAPGRTYTAGTALLPQVEHAGAPLGVTRFVVVQPSFYGTDNSVLLDSLAALDGRGRAVAVIDPATFRDAARFHAAGVRGLRLNLYSTLGAQRGDTLASDFAATAAVAKSQGWHVEVLATLPVLAREAALLAASPVPIVIDHFGIHGGHTPDSTEARALLALLRHDHVWMKLSAPYRSSEDALATQPDPAWLAAILGSCADRCVWGSDWPHTPAHGLQTGQDMALPYRDLAYADVLDGFRRALPPGIRTNAILTHNPARLYDY